MLRATQATLLLVSSHQSECLWLTRLVVVHCFGLEVPSALAIHVVLVHVLPRSSPLLTADRLP